MKKTHKENNTKVIIPKEIITYLMDLADTLFEKDYYSYIEYANILIDDILDFIHTLPHAPHYNLSHTAEMRFNRYGRDLQYAFFKRKSSKHTTWYVFFNRKGDRYITLYQSSRSGALLPLSPLRTVRATFIAYGSSNSKLLNLNRSRLKTSVVAFTPVTAFAMDKYLDFPA